MKAIRFHAAIPRYALGLVGRHISRSILWSGLSCTSFDEIPEPALPNDEWVKIKTRYGGICGSDLSAISLHASPYYSALNSFPFTFGHENVGYVAQVGARAGDWQVGERVVVEPLLWCAPRGFADLCRFCARGEINLCERIAKGHVAPGLMTGFCRDTGGSWGEYFVAHRSQLYRVPEQVSDENAVLVEPFAVALHVALQYRPPDDAIVLILGAGIIGLLTLAALRVTGARAKIWMVARYPFQAEAAQKLGADAILNGQGDYFAEIAERTRGHVLNPIIGRRVLQGGGVDVTYECVGSDAALDAALRLTRPRGHVVLVGAPGIAQNVDWTAIFLKELEVVASFTYNHAEPYSGERRAAYAIALELMSRAELDLGWLVTHRFHLAEYARAFRLLTQRGHSRVLKAVFEF